MSDTPLMQADTPVRTLELEAIRIFRKAFPDGPDWQTLHADTRAQWVECAERRMT